MPAVIAFVSQKGGVGKSTLARALAAVCTHAGLKVLLADLDPGQQTLLHWYEARSQNEGASTFAVAGFIEPSEAIEQAAESDVLILDTPAGANATTQTIAQLAHLVVLPTGPSLDDLHPTVLLMHELSAARIPQSRLVAALCRVLGESEAQAARLYIEDAGYAVLPGYIPESSVYRAAHNRGRSLTETNKPDLNLQADALIEALLEKVAGVTDGDEAAASAVAKGGAA